MNKYKNYYLSQAKYHHSIDQNQSILSAETVNESIKLYEI
ncbi:MAG: hypothetical protein ACI9J4_001297 [Paraglaciecola sp.]|jgi:hypothetical protein